MKLYEMGATPTGPEAYSVMQYIVRAWPDQMKNLLDSVYNDGDDQIVAWAVGFTYAFCLLEECGLPDDLDEVLYSRGWAEGPYDIVEELKKLK